MELRLYRGFHACFFCKKYEMGKNDIRFVDNCPILFG